jgi:hypothetical protein
MIPRCYGPGYNDLRQKPDNGKDVSELKRKPKKTQGVAGFMMLSSLVGRKPKEAGIVEERGWWLLTTPQVEQHSELGRILDMF